MALHLYLSVIPEALIVSMLPPADFGQYFAVGTQQRSRGQAFFFEIDAGFDDPYFALDAGRRRCVPHPDGTPKHSVYVSVYRVLEHVPLAAFCSLYLTTDDGRVLELESRPFKPEAGAALHLYQEFCPVTPRVASALDPLAFSRFITTPNALIMLPRLVFCELELGELAHDPAGGSVPDLPYPHLDHLRDCLLGLRASPAKAAKMVMRNTSNEVLYRTVRNGFFIGDASGLLYYPLPSRQALEERHRAWWRSAQMISAG
jgi:hypothetical protein